jgi:hypothetical protein
MNENLHKFAAPLEIMELVNWYSYMAYILPSVFIDCETMLYHLLTSSDKDVDEEAISFWSVCQMEHDNSNKFCSEYF